MINQKLIKRRLKIKDDTNLPTLYLNFSFYKVDPKWRWLNDIGKDEAAKEFSSLIDIANTKMKVMTYSTIGMRKESDFMLWSISDSVEKIQVLSSKVYTTVLGKYIDTSEVYLSASRPSIYSNKITPSFMEDDNFKIQYRLSICKVKRMVSSSICKKK